MSSEINNGPLRIWSPDDYSMLQSWWEGHGWPPVAQRFLPPVGVIYDDKAAGWLYMDNGGVGVAMIEWLVTNPKASAISAYKALISVIGFLRSEARRMDYPIILTTCKQESLARLLVRCGFTRTDDQMIHLAGVFQ